MAGTCPRLVGKSRSGIVACYAYGEYSSFCTELLDLLDSAEVPAILVFGRKYLVAEVLPGKALVRVSLEDLTHEVMEAVAGLVRFFRRGEVRGCGTQVPLTHPQQVSG